MTEQWKPVVGYENQYLVSDHGRVKSIASGRFKAQAFTTHGYYCVQLWKNGQGSTKQVHSLVAKTFLGDYSGSLVVCHGPKGKLDNSLANLRWDTQSNNILDSVREGTQKETRKTQCPRGHDLAGSNLRPDLLKSGKRTCLACNRARQWVSQRGGDFQRIADLCYEHTSTPSRLNNAGLI